MSKFNQGEWAYRCKPTEQVHIMCTDRPGDWPVVSLRSNGDINVHLEDGRYAFRSEAFDLIPIQRPRAKVRGWFNVYPHGVFGVYETRAEADKGSGTGRIDCVWIEEADPPEGQE